MKNKDYENMSRKKGQKTKKNKRCPVESRNFALERDPVVDRDVSTSDMPPGMSELPPFASRSCARYFYLLSPDRSVHCEVTTSTWRPYR